MCRYDLLAGVNEEKYLSNGRVLVYLMIFEPATGVSVTRTIWDYCGGERRLSGAVGFI